MSRSPDAPFLKRHWPFLLKAAVSIAILAIIFNRFDTAEMWRVINRARPQPLVMAFVAAAVILAGKALKWFLLVRQVSTSISFKQAAVSLVAGMGLGVITPSRVGEVARVTYLSVPDRSRFVGLVAVDRFFDLSTVILVGAVAIALALNMRAAGLAVALPVVAAVILIFIPQLPTRLVRRLTNHAIFPWHRQANLMADGLALLDTRVLALVFMLSGFIFGLATLQFYWLLSGFQAPESLLAAAVSFPVLTLAGVLPVTVAGFGAREGASILILSRYDISEAVAVNAALLSFALNTLLPALLGLLLSPAVPSRREEPGTGAARN